MRWECIANSKLEDTGFNYTMSLIQGKYKMIVLYTLMEFEVVRFNEMKRYIGEISYKTLSATLKELEADGLVHREEYPPDTAQGRIQPDGAGKDADPDPRRDVRVGR